MTKDEMRREVKKALRKNNPDAELTIIFDWVSPICKGFAPGYKFRTAHGTMQAPGFRARRWNASVDMSTGHLSIR